MKELNISYMVLWFKWRIMNRLDTHHFQGSTWILVVYEGYLSRSLIDQPQPPPLPPPLSPSCALPLSPLRRLHIPCRRLACHLSNWQWRSGVKSSGKLHSRTLFPFTLIQQFYTMFFFSPAVLVHSSRHYFNTPSRLVIPLSVSSCHALFFPLGLYVPTLSSPRCPLRRSLPLIHPLYAVLPPPFPPTSLSLDFTLSVDN